ncbi:MAG: hypothetical protein JWM05_326 [Acidimicrobiales bacterium]|nr:hypothetical protein [Acidimicrobiales bacterium]
MTERGGRVASLAVPGRLRGLDPTARAAALLGGLAAVAALPLLLLGPGNDLDVGNVFRSGRSIARHLSYTPSRPPGALAHETAVGILDLLGGPVLTNLSSLLMAIVAGVALFQLLRREGVGPVGLVAAAVMVLNPWFVIAATSTADYVWGLALVLLAAHALRDRHPALAGVLGALAIACRLGSGLLLVAMLLAELGEGPEARRRVRTTALVTAGASVLVFVPSFLSAGMSLKFAQNDFSSASPLVLAGRTLVKDLLLLGPLGSLIAVAAVPAVVAAVRGWRTSWLVRFAVPGLVLSQLLFLRFPWKEAHLLPCLLCGAILLGVAVDQRVRETGGGWARRALPFLLPALVVSQLLYAVVRIDVIAPNHPGDATGGKPALGVGAGPVLVDVRCRRRDPHAYLGAQKGAVERAWTCAKPFGG